MNKIIIVLLFFIDSAIGQNHLAIHFKIMRSDRSLQYNNISLENVVTQRNMEESPASSFEIGLTKYWAASKFFNLGIGCNYSRYGYGLQELKDLIWPSEITPSGYVYNPSLPHEIKPSIYINYIDIPFKLEYRHSGTVGFIPYISISNQFYINSLYNTKTDIGNQNSFGNDYKSKKYNVTLGGGLCVGFKVGKFIPTFGVHFDYQLLNSIERDINEKFYAYGLYLSLKYIY